MKGNITLLCIFSKVLSLPPMSAKKVHCHQQNLAVEGNHQQYMTSQCG